MGNVFVAKTDESNAPPAKKQKSNYSDVVFELKEVTRMTSPGCWTLGDSDLTDTNSVVGFPQPDCMVRLSHCRMFNSTGSTNDTELLFFRKETVEYFNNLSTSLPRSKATLYAEYGSPGIGKTITLITYICHEMTGPNRKDGDAALFYRILDKSYVLVYQMNGVCYIAKVLIVNASVVIEYALSAKFNVLYVVCDGGTKENNGLDVVERISTMFPDARVFLSSSMSGSIPSSKPKKIFTVKPWKYDTYQVMIKDDRFFNAYKNNLISEGAKRALDADSIAAGGEAYDWDALLYSDNTVWTTEMKECVLREKFTVAGHSARWMFALSYEEAISDIQRYANSVTNAENMMNGLMGQSSDQFVNHMFSQFDPGSTFTSEVCARTLLTICELTHITKMTNMCTHRQSHPALDGIVLEMDALYYLKKGILDSRCYMYASAASVAAPLAPVSSQTRKSKHGASKASTAATSSVSVPAVPPFGSVENRYSVPKWESFPSVATWTGPNVPTEVPECGIAFIPDVFNNGGFDFVVLRLNEQKQVCAEFVQVTRGKEHDLRIFYMDWFIDTFNSSDNVAKTHRIQVAKVTILCPAKTVHEFTKPTHAKVIGKLTDYGWDLSKLEIVAFIRSA